MPTFLHMQQKTEGRQCRTMRILVIKSLCSLYIGYMQMRVTTQPLNLPARAEGAVTLGGGPHILKH